MYSELVTVSLRVVERDDAGVQPAVLDAALRRALGDSARRLGRRPGPGVTGTPEPADAPADLARELDYDVALIRLCRLHGVAADPSGFTRPGVERRRLEHELEVRGIDVGAGPPAVPGPDAGAGERAAEPAGRDGVQDPPDGSSRS